MVSFTCGRCNDVVKKPKVLAHAAYCHCNQFTCVDCMNVFTTSSVKEHTTCVTEVEKYQGKWKQRQKQTQNNVVNAKMNNKCNLNNKDEVQKSQSRKEISRRTLMNDLSSDDNDDDDDDSWITQKKTRNTEKVVNSRKIPVESLKTSCIQERILKNKNEVECIESETVPNRETKSSINHMNGKSLELEKKKMEKNCEPTSNYKRVRSDDEPEKVTTNSSQFLEVEKVQLGTYEEVRELLNRVYREKNVNELTGKQIARELAEAYKSNITRTIKQALYLLNENGVIHCCDYNNVEKETEQDSKRHTKWCLVKQ